MIVSRPSHPLAGPEDIGTGVGAGVVFQGGSILKGVVTGVLVSLIVRFIDRAIFKER